MAGKKRKGVTLGTKLMLVFTFLVLASSLYLFFRLSGKVTMIVIAHRITTIRNCDHIYKIADGTATEVKYEDLVQ